MLQDVKGELNRDSHLVNTASCNAPRGEMQLAICFALLFFTLLLRDEEYCVKVACAGCIISTFVTIYYKLDLQASSTYVLCALSVIMNSIAFGYLLSPMTATAVSSVVAAIQAFLSLPFSATVSGKM